MHNFFSFNVRCFHLSGLPLFEKPKFNSTFTKCFWHIIKVASDISHVIHFVTVLIATVLANDFHKYCAGAVPILYTGGYYIRYFGYRLKQDKVNDLYESINNMFNQYLEKDEKFMEFFERHTRTMRRISRARIGIELFFTSLSCNLFVVQSFFGSTALPSVALYPFDQTTFWATFSVSSLQSFAFFSLVFRTGASDSFLTMVTVVLATQLRYLKQNLPTAFHSQTTHPESRCEYVKWWIKQHNSCLRVIRLFQEIINPFLLGTYATVLMFVLFTGVIITSGEAWNLNQKICILSVGAVNLIQLYITSTAADTLIEMELTVADNAYNFEVITLDKSSKQNYIAIKEISKKSSPLSAYGFHPLSSPTFGVLLRATFSYYLAIIQINQHYKTRESN